jgi:DNA-binding transcriptional LysR family regulator
MLDGISLDQLRTFIAAAETGSFSAAGRRLGRAQSVISQTIATLETRLGVRLFERAARFPVLTQGGRALLADARAVTADLDLLKARARGLAGGLEPELSVAVDVLFPLPALTCAVAAFQVEFPSTALRLSVEALGAVIEPVLDGRCAFGVMGTYPEPLPLLRRERLCGVQLVQVAAPEHAMARLTGPIPPDLAAQHTQLVLMDRSRLTEGREFGVFSNRSWRIADLGAKHAFLRAGLGWGSMPLHLVAEDLAAGRLVRIELEDGLASQQVLPLAAGYRTDSPPGPAGRWLIERLKRGLSDALGDGTMEERSAPSVCGLHRLEQ